MQGISWTNGNPYWDGGIEVWDDGVIVTAGRPPVISAKLTDRSLILSLYHFLGDWLVATNPDLPTIKN